MHDLSAKRISPTPAFEGCAGQGRSMTAAQPESLWHADRGGPSNEILIARGSRSGCAARSRVREQCHCEASSQGGVTHLRTLTFCDREPTFVCARGWPGQARPQARAHCVAGSSPRLSGLNFWIGCTALILLVFERLATIRTQKEVPMPCATRVAFFIRF
jgi:hypothetical protein